MNRIQAFQELLTEAYTEYLAKTGKRRVSDNEFARYLGVSPASFNQWINGNRTPDLENTARLAKKLGPRVFDILGFPTVIEADDPELKFIAQNWQQLPGDVRQQIFDHVVEITSQNKGSVNGTRTRQKAGNDR